MSKPLTLTEPTSNLPGPKAVIAQVLGLTGRRDLKATLETMQHLLYPADPILESHLQGMTYLEVAVFRQMENAAEGRFGSGEALERLLDRLIGKVANKNENLNVGMNYRDFLNELKKKDPIDVTAESQPRTTRGGAEEIS